MELIYLFLFSVASINLVNCDNACSNLNTCGECIGYPHLQCVWCAKEDMKGFRCLAEQQANKTEDWCPRDQLYNPEKFSVNVITNKDFQSIQNGNAIQFKPQEIFIKVRPGIPAPFTMSYKPAEDFPLDVYILMDMSYSMQTVKKDLQNQIADIFNKLDQLSNNSLLGIGSFVEKPVFPYYDKNTREISYSFKNYLALTKDKEKFMSVLKNINFGANFDDLEAGFDALMQVITCIDDIGWRNNSRRIIIYLTESAYHSVGDGKMIGIIKPNDMQCHLKDGVHETGTVFDYPSVSQLNLKALENKMKIIFVTKSEVRDAYEALENYILDSKYEELKRDSKTVEIIDRAFKELTASVGLDTRDWPSFVTLTLDQDCTPNSERNCRITPETPTVTIPAELKVNMCPEQKKYKLVISPRSASDILTINLEIDCECNCEKNNNIISSKCSNAGYYQCGICKCVQGRYGETCSCTGTSTTEEHLKKCQANGTSVCSGNGICICGLCKCHDTFSGQFCQYDNTGCPNLCSGHGDCEMGVCQCHDPWANDDCSCDTTDHSACIDPYSHKVCAGHGTCFCGKCTCDKIKEGNDEKYSGSFCEGCPDCVEKRCKELGDYVYCYYMDQTNNECDLLLNKVSKTIRMVNITEFQSPTHEWRDAKICERLLDSGDSIVFKFRTDLTTRKLHILVQNEPKPPNRANLYIAVASAIAAVVLIGLLTLIAWKILIDLHDKREYNKFAKQAQAEGYDVSSNPLYEQPTTDFHNPAYAGNQ